jgi:flavin reductase (DIM6/NTAB) family NADH-FMN oxidoreductase RutF
MTAFVELTDPTLFSRVLYANPVCLLTSFPAHRLNCMTISWLTPSNNKGGVILSMNRKRHTCLAMSPDAHFTLSVPVAGMEAVVLAIGGVSGADVDKFDGICLASSDFDAGSPRPLWPPAIADTAAVLECTVRQVLSGLDDGHVTLYCQIVRARVLKSHWDGKRFHPAAPGARPILSFLGSQTFGYVCNTPG